MTPASPSGSDTPGPKKPAEGKTDETTSTSSATSGTSLSGSGKSPLSATTSQSASDSQKSSPQQTSGQKTASATTASTDAVSLLKADHRKVEQLFKQYEAADGEDEKSEIARKVCLELTIHTALEEEIFYPACRDKDVDEDKLDESQVEHDSAKLLIAELSGNDAGSDYYDAKMKVLSEYIKHHVGEEEERSTGVFAQAQQKGIDLKSLGQRLQQRKQELQEDYEERLPSPEIVSLTQLALRNQRGRNSPNYREENSKMARQSNSRDRDDQGRFTSDDNRGSQSRSRDYDDDRNYRSSSRDYDDDRGYRSSSRDYDDDRGNRSGGRGQGHGGWFGDSEGHSQASREGWENRGGSQRSSGRYDDNDDNYRGRSGSGQYRDRDDQGRFTSDDSGSRSSSSRSSGRYDDDDDRGGYSSRGGQSRDSEGRYRSSGSSDRSRSNRSNDDDREYRSGGRGQGGQGHGGWFGDSQGHSEAAREGWEHRGGSQRSSSRYDNDDDNRNSRSSGRGQGQGHGGWFGDPEGHSRASREGWRNRD